MKKVVFLIPARSGSSVKEKNIKIYKNKPLIFHSIDVALKSKFSQRIIVSTDSLKFKNIILAKYKKKIEIPFLRPKNISKNTSTDYEWIKHALLYLKKNENYVPDIVVQLRPTTPNRKYKIVDKAIELFLKNFKKYSSLRSASKFSQPPQKMFKIVKGVFKGYFSEKNLNEYYNLPRQHYPENYIPNGYIDILKPNIILNTKFLNGKKILPFVTEVTNDIDDLNDFKKK